jgi:hypothetical protein
VAVSRSALAHACPSGRVRLAAVIAAACAMYGLAACTQPGPATPTFRPGTPIPAPVGPSADPAAVTAAKTDALKVYSHYLAAYVKAAASGTWNSTDIDKYAADPLRQQAHVQLKNLVDSKLVMTGQPTSNPAVTAVNVSTNPHTVLIADCIGMTDWKQIRTSTGQPPSNASQPAFEAVSLVVVAYPNEGWLVQQSNDAKVSGC